MIGRCMNSNCNLALHTLSEGRLFHFEINSVSVSASDNPLATIDENQQSQTAQFWLCADCASSVKLTLDPIDGLKLVPLISECATIAGQPTRFRGFESC